MKSIRSRLTVGLLIGIVVLSLAASATLYAFVRNSLLGHFDGALLAKAGALAGLIKSDPREESGVEFDFADETLPEFSRPSEPEYFQIWLGNGDILERSRSLAEADIPRTSNSATYDVTLPDGRAGRVALVRVNPHIDDEDMPSGGAETNAPEPATPAPKDGPLTLVVARERGDVDYTLTLLLGSLIAFVVLLCGAAALLVPAVVARGLRPLGEMADQASKVDVDKLDHRFPVEGLPTELRPISMRLNDLLDRLQGAFKRERRFTSDVSHELRTPLAELRTLAEVALKWPHDDQDTAARAQSFRDALDISQQMETVVTTLLAIARAESGQLSVSRQPVQADEVLRHASNTFARRASERGVAVDLEVGAPSALVETDPAMLRAIVDNLISNAVDYTPRGGSVMCRVDGAADGEVELSITNTNDTLTDADLPHLFEPFWRKDAARSDPAHSGLGLALVALYAKLLGVGIRAGLTTTGAFRVALALRRPANLP